jgi:hypothetical protein
MDDYPASLEAEEAQLETTLASIQVRLAQVAERLAAEPLIVKGSRKNPRPHPLLSVEQELQHAARRARTELRVLHAHIREKQWRQEQARLVERANEITGWKTHAPTA